MAGRWQKKLFTDVSKNAESPSFWLTRFRQLWHKLSYVRVVCLYMCVVLSTAWKWRGVRFVKIRTNLHSRSRVLMGEKRVMRNTERMRLAPHRTGPRITGKMPMLPMDNSRIFRSGSTGFQRVSSSGGKCPNGRPALNTYDTKADLAEEMKHLPDFP